MKFGVECTQTLFLPYEGSKTVFDRLSTQIINFTNKKKIKID